VNYIFNIKRKKNVKNFINFAETDVASNMKIIHRRYNLKKSNKFVEIK
jgi:hypothetical protein